MHAEIQIELSGRFLIGQLQALSFQFREKRKPAIALWDNFQSYLQLKLKENLPGIRILLNILSIIGHETELTISPNLKVAISEAMFSEFSKNKELPQSKANMSLAEINTQFDEQLAKLESSGEMSVFGLADNLISEFQHLPTDASVMIIMQHFRSSRAFGYEAATLLVAHPNSKVRSQLISLYESNFTGKEISPIGLRRLIGLRNWLPVNERTKLDRLIKKVRQKGIECAPMPETIKGEQEFYASLRDGAGAQMVWMFIPDHKRKRQFSSILSTFPKGVKDVMAEQNLSKSKERFFLKQIQGNLQFGILKKVDANFMQRFVEAGLATNLKKNTLPPIRLLEVAESLGVPYWQPNPLDVKAILTELKEKIGDKIHSPTITKALLESEYWASDEYQDRYEFIATWLIDESWEFENILEKELDKKARSGKKRTLSLDEVKKSALNYFESDRNILLHTMLWTALLGAHSLDKKIGERIPWEVFTLIAEQIAQGIPLKDIPFIRGLANQTTLNLAD
jgi:hypothetical protein